MGLNLIKINSRFKKFGQFILQYRWPILIVFLGLLVFSALGLKGLELDSSNDVWYFDDDPVILTEKKFEKIFGNSDIVAVHITTNDVVQKDVLVKIQDLSETIEKALPFTDDVISITNLEYIKGTEFGIEIGELIPDSIPAGQQELENLRQQALAKHSINNRLLSADGTETFIIVDLKETPDEWKIDTTYQHYLQNKAERFPEIYSGLNTSKAIAPNQVIGVVIDNITKQAEYRSLNPKAAGVYPLTHYKRNFFQSESPRLMRLGLIISIIILGLSLRSFRGVIFPVITALAGMTITLGIEGYFGAIVQPSVIPIPLFLGLAVSIGYSIHVFNFYKKRIQEIGDRQEAVIYAIEKTGWPLLFTALTTICALMSFLFIQIKILNWVGITTAAIVAITYLLAVGIFPIFLSFGRDKKFDQKQVQKSNGFLADKLAALSRITMDNPIKILLVYILVAIIAVFGLFRAKVDFSSAKTMGRKVEYVDQMLSVGESQIGSFNNYSICIEFDQKNAVKNPVVLQRLDKFIREVEDFKLTKRTTSILDKLKEINKVLNEEQESYYRVPDSRMMVAQSLLLYENAGGEQLDKWVNYNYDKLRIRVEVSEFIQEELLSEYDRIEELGNKYFPEARISTIGSIAKFSDMCDKVARGQVKAFSYSIIIIAILMMLVFGSVRVGLIAIIPNLSPALAIGGIMGFFNIPLDMITSTIMPMLLGLAVDDTIHFINHVKYEFEKTGNYDLATERAFRTVGKALLMTSLVLILNFSAYTTSIAKLYIHFGILAGTGILAALISDLLVTPVCLKIGRAFGPEK